MRKLPLSCLVAGSLLLPCQPASAQQDSAGIPRLISARETARLMGLDDSYELPENYNEAYHLTGDGVAVPVVRHLAKFLLEPILARKVKRRKEAA